MASMEVVGDPAQLAPADFEHRPASNAAGGS
jgi:hypothetical protein